MTVNHSYLKVAELSWKMKDNHMGQKTIIYDHKETKSDQKETHEDQQETQNYHNKTNDQKEI